MVARMNVAILGAGAWGTALAAHLAKHHAAVLWARDGALAEVLRQTRENPRYLPGAPLPPGLGIETDLLRALQHAASDDALCVVAAPVAALRALCADMRAAHAIPAHLIWLCKGFEADSQLLPHQVVSAVLGEHSSCGALSGPSFAREVASGLPVALTVASGSAVCRERAVQAFHHAAMRIYTGDDVVGVEVGGAVKNVLAIATGIADGLGLGFNARAALITRGLAEMSRLGVALGGRAETFTGLTGLGDLILTATGGLVAQSDRRHATGSGTVARRDPRGTGPRGRGSALCQGRTWPRSRARYRRSHHSGRMLRAVRRAGTPGCRQRSVAT